MKTCLICGTAAQDDAATCLNCGEGTWSDPEAKSEPTKADIAPKGGRK